jgi:hypothetical protein
MIRSRTFIGTVIGILLNSCGNLNPGRVPERQDHDPIQRGRTAALEFRPEAETGLAYATGETSADAWIFLIAGSLRGAGFAQEVIEQRRLWIERGADPSEIACYFVIPDQAHFDQDADQYRNLAPELRSCKLASMKSIAGDLARSATRPKSSLYVYVTSHGDQPLSFQVEESDDPVEWAKANWLLKKYPALDRYMLALDADPQGTTNQNGLLDAIDAGTPPEHIFLTPDNFSAALQKFPGETVKTVVLQGCYSGGFVNDTPSVDSSSTLTSVDNITVITAARHDRPSFGCGLGEETTFFGGALLESLREGPDHLPDAVDWPSVFAAASAKVTVLEGQFNFDPSHPVWFSNQK